jgi:hypothetical protein
MLAVHLVDLESKKNTTHGNVNDTPNPTFSIFFEYSSNLLCIREITLMNIDFHAQFLLFGRIFGQLAL